MKDHIREQLKRYLTEMMKRGEKELHEVYGDIAEMLLIYVDQSIIEHVEKDHNRKQ